MYFLLLLVGSVLLFFRFLTVFLLFKWRNLLLESRLLVTRWLEVSQYFLSEKKKNWKHGLLKKRVAIEALASLQESNSACELCGHWQTKKTFAIGKRDSCRISNILVHLLKLSFFLFWSFFHERRAVFFSCIFLCFCFISSLKGREVMTLTKTNPRFFK